MLGVRTLSPVSAAWALALSLCAAPAAALEPSALEARTIQRALGSQPERDAAPHGKRIESVQVVRLPVFDEDDPVPDFVNWFHFQTLERVIRRELLFQAGDVYDAERVEETLRNLQLIQQFGVVVIVALKGSTPDQIKLAVIVRDVWSLRLNYELQGRPTSVNYLLINLSEDNLFGTRTRLGGVFTLQPDRYSIGAALAHPRVLGTKADAFGRGGVFVNLDSGKPEGSYGSLALVRSFVSLRDKWAFLAGSAWVVEQTRLFRDRRPVVSEHGIPVEYATRVARGGAELARAFGTKEKTILTFGVELNRRKFSAERDAEVSEQDFAAFVRDELPVSDTRLSPFVQLEQRTTRYLATRDVETLELQESFSLGHQAALRVYPALRDVASSRNLLGAVSWLGYTWRLGSGFLRTVGSSSIEHADLARHQASAQGALRVVSPKVGFARLVLDGALVSTYRNYLNRKLVLGGDTRPRGYVSSTFRGPSGFAATAEARSSAVDVLSARVGAVVFYDLGGTGDSVGQIALHQSLGAGVRVLFPQLNRASFRVDWAAPLTAGRGRRPDRALPGGIYFTFGQAFDVPKLKLPEILGAETTLLELAQ